VVGTLRLYYDAVIAAALMAVVAISCGLIAAVITGDAPPGFPASTIAFVLICAFLFLRLRSKSGTFALRNGYDGLWPLEDTDPYSRRTHINLA
jgi:hypothetical protein